MIQTEPEDIERIRARIRKMSDLELRQYGRAAASTAQSQEEPQAESSISSTVGRGASGMEKAASEAVSHCLKTSV
jgi:hypothetical protein